MTKKSKDDTLPLPKQHDLLRINSTPNSSQQNLLSSVNTTKTKKSIKKPQQLSLIQKVDTLKQKNTKLYKHAQKKIDRMIEIIDEINDKHLLTHIKTITNDSGGTYPTTQNKESQQYNQSITQEKPSQNQRQNQSKSQSFNEKPSEEQKQLIKKTLTYLHNLLTYEKPLSHIKKQFQSFYSRLSTFSKELQSEQHLPEDKKFLIPQNGLNFQQTRLVEQLIKQHFLRTGQFNVAALFDSYGKQDIEEIIPTQTNKIPSVSNLSNKSSKSKGKKQISKSSLKNTKSLSKSIKKRPKVQLIDLEQNFHECFSLRNQLIRRDFQEAISWCVQQRLYETHSNPLQYQLRLAEIKLLIKEEKFNLAYEKIQKNMTKFIDSYEQQINLLIGYLLFSCGWNSQKIFISEEPSQQQNAVRLENQQESQLKNEDMFSLLKQRYEQFYIKEGQIQQLAQKFTHTYFIHYEISQFDTLQICYKVGKMYEKQYFDSIKMFSEKDRQDFLKHRHHCEFTDTYKNNKGLHSIILPFQIPVDKQHLYHSIFVCPVTKEVLSSNDGVQFLSCGHLVSQSAKKSMAEVRRSNHKQKCPVCQKDRASDVIKVSF